jgi:hypothetical protein
MYVAAICAYLRTMILFAKKTTATINGNKTFVSYDLNQTKQNQRPKHTQTQKWNISETRSIGQTKAYTNTEMEHK